MTMNFFGRKGKGGKSSKGGGEQPLPEYKPYDFDNPEAFSEANLAKVQLIWHQQERGQSDAYSKTRLLRVV